MSEVDKNPKIARMECQNPHCKTVGDIKLNKNGLAYLYCCGATKSGRKCGRRMFFSRDETDYIVKFKCVPPHDWSGELETAPVAPAAPLSPPTSPPPKEDNHVKETPAPAKPPEPTRNPWGIC